jgi:hypothetical protein
LKRRARPVGRQIEQSRRVGKLGLPVVEQRREAIRVRLGALEGGEVGILERERRQSGRRA